MSKKLKTTDTITRKALDKFQEINGHDSAFTSMEAAIQTAFDFISDEKWNLNKMYEDSQMKEVYDNSHTIYTAAYKILNETYSLSDIDENAKIIRKSILEIIKLSNENIKILGSD